MLCLNTVSTTILKKFKKLEESLICGYQISTHQLRTSAPFT
jgi:hypothetical protein